MNYRLVLLIISLLSYADISAQVAELSLEDCLQKAENYSPILAAKSLQAEQLLAKTKRINREIWPKIDLNGKATWQSDVLSIPLNFPGVEIPTPPTEQYGFSLDVQQTIWDGGVVKAQKQIAEAQSLASQAQVEADFYQVKGQIIQLFFGAMLADQQYDYLELLSLEIDRQLDRLTHAVENGIAIESDKNQLLAKKLELEMQMQTADHRKTAALSALGFWTGETIAFETKLITPMTDFAERSVQRPEFLVLDATRQNLAANEQLIKASNLPKLGAFAQLGYGQPGLNMFLNEWDTYAVIGAKLSMPLSWMYSGSQKLDKQQLELQRRQIGLQQDQLVLQTQAARSTHEQDVLRLTNMAATDEQLVTLREEITQTHAVQLQEGIITITDYLTAVNNEELARQNQLLHQIQKLQSIATYNWLSGE